MLRVVLDTNVILSGLLYGGIPAALLESAQEELFVLCISQHMYDEVLDKLVHKFGVDEHILNDVAILLSHAVMYTPSKTILFPPDPDDAYLLELVEECEADYLVTGDKKHLLPLRKWKITRIITPKHAKEVLL